MSGTIIRFAILAAAMFPLTTAVAEPIKLKFSFVTSDRSNLYQAWVRPFVDAVNAEGRDIVEIEVYAGGALEKAPAQQPQAVLDGRADLAMTFAGYSPERFWDMSALELPGLFNDMREATLVFTRLIAANAFKSYQDFYVVGTYASEPESIHSRKAIGSVADLRGLRIRTNSITEGAGLAKLGAVPVPLPINQVPTALSRGEVDAATAPPAMLAEFGIGRATSHHFMLRTSTAQLAILMNPQKLNSLPREAQRIIRKYSGEWLARRCIAAFTLLNEEALEVLRADPRRQVVIPSQFDRQTARTAFKTFTDEWVSANPQRRELLAAIEHELARIRSAEP
jgi:TRAP-type C4-dicarboxylate transport system substrate-binding protein